MIFFEIERASFLQYFTFSLEAVGISLAVLEVRFPGVTERINQQLRLRVLNAQETDINLKAERPRLMQVLKLGGPTFPTHRWGTLLFLGVITVSILSMLAIVTSFQLKEYDLLADVARHAN